MRIVVTPVAVKPKRSRRKKAISHQFLLHLGFNISGECEKGLLNVDGSLGGCLHEFDAVLDGQLLAPVLGHLPLVIHIAFVAQDHLFL